MTQEPTEATESTVKKGPSVARTFGVVAILTVFSKIAGLVRDMVVAGAYGTTVIADAYNFAYLFTGNILILFGGLGGPFHSSTVSVVTPKKDDRNVGQLITQVFMVTAVVLMLVSLVFYFAAPHLVPLLKDLYAKMASISTKDQFEEETLRQLIIMLPLIVISGLVGVSYGVLNVYHRVVSSSLSPAIASLAIIIAIAVSNHDSGLPLAIGTLIGAIGQLLIQIPPMLQLKLNWQLRKEIDPGLAEYSKMLWPAVFSTSIGQLIVYVDAYFALQQQSVWTAITYSNRLVQLPLGILLTAMLVPILPLFTQHVAEEKFNDLKEDIRRALRFLWFLALPISAILLAISLPIVQVLFMRGNFKPQDSMLVNNALIFLIPSIFFYVARDLMTRVFYAYKDSETPYRIALLAIFVKAGLDWLLIQMMPDARESAISLATSLITIFNLSLLTWALKRKVGNLGFTALIRPISVMLLGTIICGVVTWASYNGLAQLAAPNEQWLRLLYVVLSSGVGFALYVLLCVALKLEEPRAVAKRLPIIKRFVV